MVDGHVARHRKYEGGFSHTRACRQHHHVASLPTTGDAVKVGEAARHTAHPVFVVARGIDSANGLVHQASHGIVAFADVAFGDFKKLRFGGIEQVEYVGGVFKGLFHDGV